MEPSPFKFLLRAPVRVRFNNANVSGTIISRLESQGAGNQYAVFANYDGKDKHATAHWFMEKEITPL